MFPTLKRLERFLRHRLRRPGRVDVHQRIRSLEQSLETVLLLQAEAHVQRVRNLAPSTPLGETEFKVYSQFGEDGILQFLTRHVPCPDARFVEFGVEDFREANCRFLLHRDPWQGLVMDGNPNLEARLQTQSIYWARNLKGRTAFITAENIDGILAEEGFTGDLGILSIDIDGNDYWVWKAITVASPRIVICEYNSVFGCQRPVVVPYVPSFRRQTAHASWLYAGASLPALCHLAHSKGYAFVGSNRAGNNAFFVRQDVLGELRSLEVEEGYVESSFRESRGPQGQFTYLAGGNRLTAIGAMPLLDISTGESITAADLIISR
jgi:hypothetical protein